MMVERSRFAVHRDAVLGEGGETERRVVDLVRRLSSCRTTEAIMAEVTEATRALVGADGVTFVLRDGDKCFYADEDAVAPLWKGQRFPMSACISGWVMLNRRPAVIEDITKDDRIPQDAYRPTFVRSLAMTPVRAEDPIAAIGAYWRQVYRPTERQLALLQTIADAAALALANIELRGLQKSLSAAKSEAESALRNRSALVAAISHDLRQPLQSLALASFALRDGPPAARHDLLAIMDQALQSARRMVSDLAELSRLDAGAVEVRRKRVDLDELMDRLSREYALNGKEEGVQVRRVRTSLTIEADPALVERILRNLLENALRYARQGRVVIGCRRRGGMVALQVADDGVGIPADKLAAIFEEFIQIERADARGAAGLGLGLAIVRRLAGLLGGRVEVRSREGRGSCFSVLLPAVPSTDQAVGSL